MSNNIPEYSQLIPQLSETGLDATDWLQQTGDYSYAIAYSSLFWPTFHTHQGCILLSGEIDKDLLADWMKTFNNNLSQVEAMLNHRHIVDLFPQSPSEPTPERLHYLGNILQEMWRAKLQQDFPERQFEVSFNIPEDEDIYDYEITFYQTK